MVNNEDRLIIELENHLRKINQIINARTKENLSEFDLTLPRLWILILTRRHPEITMSGLKEKLYMSGGALTGMVDRLVNDDLVQRARDRQDRRVVRLELTERGRELLEQVEGFRRQVVQQASCFLDHQQLAALVSHLGGIKGRLEGEQDS